MASSIETLIRKTVTKGVGAVADFNRKRIHADSDNPFLTGIHEPMAESIAERISTPVPEQLSEPVAKHSPESLSPPAAATPRTGGQDAAEAKNAPSPGVSSADSHAWLTQRMAKLSQEQTSVWRRLMNTLAGRPNV